jgi:hypothetical protein
MADWRRFIVGDAFKLSSSDINYYRDLFLLWPFLLSSIVGLSNLWTPTNSSDRMYAYKAAGAALVIFLLAKERLLLLVGSLMYVTIKLGVAAIFVHSRGVVIGFLCCGGVLTALLMSRPLREWKPSYLSNGEMHVLDFVVGIAGLIAGIGLLQWLQRL